MKLLYKKKKICGYSLHCIEVTYCNAYGWHKMGVRIGWLDLLRLVHSRSLGLKAIERYRFYTHFPVHRYALGFSFFASRILATDLLQSHCE
jgi:hypothetical protein